MQLLATAEALGLTLEEGATFTISEHVPAADDHVHYIKLLLQLRMVQDLHGTGGAYMAALDMAAARDIITKTHSHQFRADVETKLAALESKLGITTRWTEADPLFQV